MTRPPGARIAFAMVAAELIAFAEELAAAARTQTLVRWANGCAVEDKGGGAFDPVTEADREAERVMREMVHARFPDHGVSGEEWGDEPGTGRWSWSLDPVDGTRSFVCRLPTWVTLVALLRDTQPYLGLVDAPCLDETYIGVSGEAWMIWRGEKRPISASRCARLDEARFSTTDPIMFDGAPYAAFDRLRRDVKTVRYGHDGYAYARLAAGSLDLVIENGLKPYDYDALIPIVTGAGGVVGDWRGGQEFAGGRIIAAATRELYDDAVARFEAFA